MSYFSIRGRRAGLRHPLPAVPAACIGAAVLAASAAMAQPARSASCESASVEQLKSVYLACARLMSDQRVDLATGQWCAAVGEQLKQRGFDGDFDSLIAWWQRERGDTARQPPVAVALQACGRRAGAA